MIALTQIPTAIAVGLLVGGGSLLILSITIMFPFVMLPTVIAQPLGLWLLGHRRDPYYARAFTYIEDASSQAHILLPFSCGVLLTGVLLCAKKYTLAEETALWLGGVVAGMLRMLAVLAYFDVKESGVPDWERGLIIWVVVEWGFLLRAWVGDTGTETVCT